MLRDAFLKLFKLNVNELIKKHDHWNKETSHRLLNTNEPSMQDEKNLYKLNLLPAVPKINCANDPILILTHLYCDGAGDRARNVTIYQSADPLNPLSIT